MRSRRYAPLLALALWGCPAKRPTLETKMDRYPEAPRGDVVDEYHGTRVPDPYRWLEDPDSPESRAWIEAQNELTFAHLAKISVRDPLKARLTELWNYERYGSPFFEGAGKNRRFFFFKNDGLQNQSVLWVAPAAEEEPRVLLDPNQFSKDGTSSLSSMKVSKDGTRLAYSVSTGGSDWVEWRVRDIEKAEDLEDRVRWSKFSGASFSPDGAGFFYSRYPEPEEGADLEQANYFHKVYFHRIGEPQDDDRLVFEDKDHPKRGFSAHVTEDGAYLVLHVWEGTDRRNRLYFHPIGKAGVDGLKQENFVRLFDEFDASYDFVGNVGSRFFILTDKDAPRRRLVAVDVAAFEAGAAPKLEEIIPEPKEDKLESVELLGGGLLVRSLRRASDAVSFHGLDGKKVRDIELPAIGTTSGFSGRADDKSTYYAFTSFTYPTVIYRLDLETGKSTPWKTPKVGFDPADFVTEQVSYPSKDGTEIPMFVVHKKGIERDGSHPTYLYGYGGFNISLTPAFSVALVAWLERGGVYAQPSLRGGGEFGEAWHEAGMLKKKQTVFDDFAYAAKYLVKEGYTKSEKIGIGGGSNGGLLVGASITQNPKLFGAAVMMVGVLDMLRFHKFTIGHAWVSEYGSAEDPEMFETLMSYSPLHNLKPGTHYPPTLIFTADHDDRVVPAHSFKFAAALQAAQAAEAPVMIRIDTKAGHGAGKPTAKLIEETADRWAFLLDALGG